MAKEMTDKDKEAIRRMLTGPVIIENFTKGGKAVIIGDVETPEPTAKELLKIKQTLKELEAYTKSQKSKS